MFRNIVNDTCDLTLKTTDHIIVIKILSDGRIVSALNGNIMNICKLSRFRNLAKWYL